MQSTEVLKAGSERSANPIVLASARHTPCGVAQGVLFQDGVFVGLDWIRVTGPECLRLEALAWLEENYGEASRSGGLQWYTDGLTWANGARLLWGHRAPGVDSCMLELPGLCLSECHDAGYRVGILRDLLAMQGRDVLGENPAGFKVTRLDIALDVIGGTGRLFENMVRACNEGEVCKAKRFKLTQDRHTSQGVKGQTLLIGMRGDEGSGRCVRVYDKGLEMQVPDRAAGWWERIEGEYANDVADAIARRFVASPQWITEALETLASSIDFRACTRPDGTIIKHRSYKQRPRVAWWAQLITLLTADRVLAAPTEDTTLAGYARWLEVQVAPKLVTMAQATGQTIEQVILSLIHYPAFSAKLAKSMVVEEYIKQLDGARSAEPPEPRGAAVGGSG